MHTAVTLFKTESDYKVTSDREIISKILVASCFSEYNLHFIQKVFQNAICYNRLINI